MDWLRSADPGVHFGSMPMQDTLSLAPCTLELLMCGGPSTLAEGW